MNGDEAIIRTTAFVKSKMMGEGSGHDWFHVQRVHTMARQIGMEEKADLLVVELAALLHDIADWKFHGGCEEAGPQAARQWLESIQMDQATIAAVCDVIRQVSFKGAGVETVPATLEGKCVQDADRLDAIGAIGVARAFAYGGAKGRLLYDPEVSPEMHASFEQYKNSKGPTINHFYEKLLLLKDRMNTEAGRAMAKERHAFMEEFVRRFWGEIKGNR